MQVADMEQRKAFECPWQRRKGKVSRFDLDLGCILQSPPIEAAQPEGGTDQGVYRVPIFEMEKAEPLAEDLRLVIRLDAKSLARVQTPEPGFEAVHDGMFVCVQCRVLARASALMIGLFGGSEKGRHPTKVVGRAGLEPGPSS